MRKLSGAIKEGSIGGNRNIWKADTEGIQLFQVI